MPYISQDDRVAFGENVDDYNVADYMADMELGKFAGHLNYLNYRIVKAWIAKNGKKYFAFATITGTLICCILEIYRRLVAPYEDKKIKENGDVA